MVSQGRCTPTMLLREDVPADFSFLPITQYGPETTLRAYDSFGALLDDFYARREQAQRVRQWGQGLMKTVTAARDRTARKLGNQRRELEQARNRERQRQLGDLVTSNLHQMRKGMSVLRVADFYDPEGAVVDIPLDPLLTPQQNAARYYKAYNKAKTAEAILRVQLEKGEEELAYLESVLDAISRAEGERDLQEIRQELTDAGVLHTAQKGKSREKRLSSRPMEFRSTAGLRISVGKNNTQNDLLTTRQAGRGDIWLHTQKIHGAHVILWCEGKELDNASLTEAAALAAWFSQGRDSGKVAVDYTPVKYVKKPAGARPGMVVYTTYQTAYVAPDEALAKRLRVK
ncbi:MAG: NFACT family protein [Oscillospiraceae bacterium]|nr:NFACT family protein [Oscillospiraceae bacterium]